MIFIELFFVLGLGEGEHLKEGLEFQKATTLYVTVLHMFGRSYLLGLSCVKGLSYRLDFHTESDMGCYGLPCYAETFCLGWGCL